MSDATEEEEFTAMKATEDQNSKTTSDDTGIFQVCSLHATQTDSTHAHLKESYTDRQHAHLRELCTCTYKWKNADTLHTDLVHLHETQVVHSACNNEQHEVTGSTMQKK